MTFAARARPSARARDDARRGCATPSAAQRNPEKLYLEADQIIYDRDHNTVTATGNVVMYYKNRVLQADKVVYDRAHKRVLAEGRVKLTDERHNITYTPKFDLTEDFAAGFADSVEERAVDKTSIHLAAHRAFGGRGHGAQPGDLYRMRAM